MLSNSNENGGTRLTKHAQVRMDHRNISAEIIESVIEYGRIVYTRGAKIYAIGRKEVEWYKQAANINLSKCEGVQVVSSVDDEVITVYRNHDFRGLRSGRGRSRNRLASRSCRLAAI